MSDSRTENVTRNILVGTVLQIISLLMDFILRTAFIYALGKDYLGINGLFTNILLILSFTEMGIGDAIIFSMYKPILNNETERIKALMQLFKKAYRIIGLIIAVAGTLVIPFIKYFIKDAPQITEDIRIVYCLFLINTVVSYFFSYKKSIITAHQKNYIVLTYQKIFRLLQNIFQMIFLYITHNYIGFLLIMIFFTLINNYLILRKSNKLYPYLLDKSIKELTRDEKRSIYANVKSLFVYKLGSVLLNGTDNIIISIIIGIAAVGVVSNYLLIILAAETVLGQVMNAFTASIGNLNAGQDVEKQEAVFEKFFFIAMWINGFSAIALFLFLNDFIDVWIGKEYLVSQLVVFSLVLHFYINGVQFVPFTYRTTMGLFAQAKMAPIIASIINIALSLLLGYRYGLFGIFISTSIARICAMGIIDPYYIFKRFNKSPKKYFMKYWGYMFITIINCCFTYYVLTFITINGPVGLIAKAITCFVLSNLFYYIAFCRSEVLREIINSMKMIKINIKEDHYCEKI